MYDSRKLDIYNGIMRRIKPYLIPNKRYLSTSLQPNADNVPSIPIASIATVRPTSLLDSCSNLISLKKLHGLLVVRGSNQFLPIQTKLVSSYGSLGDTGSARKLFDGIPDPDLYSWKVMLRWYVVNERYDEAVGFYRVMRYCLGEEDHVVFSLVLKSCIKLLDFDEGKKIHCRIVKVGDPDFFVLNSLIDMYAKCGDMECAHKAFDQLHGGNVVSWTSIICGYVQNGSAEQGLVLFNEMRRVHVKPNEYTMGSLLTACSILEALHQGKWIHGCIIKDGLGLDCFVGTSLLDMYLKCGELSDASLTFDDLYNPDIVSWTAMIVGYMHKGLPLEALSLFSDKKWSSVLPNSVTIASVLSASAQLQNLNLGRSIHILGIKLGVEESAVVMNALVDMYAKCRAISEASCIFKRIEKKDVVTWNSMIAGYSQNDLGYEALSLFNQMRPYGYLPDAITVVSALSACASLGALHIGGSFHVYAIKGSLLSNIYISTALLNFYNKCGDVISAQRVFDEMSDHNAVSWCAMMNGYGVQGDSISCMDLFNKMLKEDLRPNDITLTSVLSTCSHTGMISEGKKYFDCMTHHYSIVPSMKHYACMVDMLARAGELEEALQFIEKMPIQADGSVWGAFIHGCRLHSRLELGEVAIRRMMELQPETPDYYVLMSNLYTSHGRWSEALAIRGLMKERGLVKLPGCSSVGMENG